MHHIKSLHLPNYLRWMVILLMFIIAFGAFSMRYDVMLFQDGDPSWHLAAGDLIRATGEIPSKDPWAFTTQDSNWYNISWLYDITISFIKEYTGTDGVLLFHMLLGALLTALIAAICIQEGAGILTTLFIASTSMFIICFGVAVRPQVVSLIFAALTLSMLRSKEAHANLLLWLLPLLNIVWVNMHGGFVILFSMLGAFWLEALLKGDRARAKTLFAVSLCCAATLLVNPYGLGVFEVMRLSIAGPLAKGFIQEWRPLTLTGQPHIYFYIIALLAIPLIRKPRIGFAMGLLSVFWAVMALNSLRLGGVLAIVMVPLLTDFLQACMARFSRLRQLEATMAYDLNHRGVVVTLAIAAVGILVFFGIPSTRAMVWDQARIYNENKYPFQEIAYLREHYPDANIYNEYSYGGYLILLGEGLKPFIDGRAETAYSHAQIYDYLKLDGCEEGWEEVIKKYKLRIALLPKTYRKSCYPSVKNGWKLVYEGPAANIFVR